MPSKTSRNYSLLDQLIINVDQGIQTLFAHQTIAERENPANQYPEQELSTSERQHVAGLMRVNHTGEVCAQALYQGQAITAKLPQVRAQMQQAASEEEDHLAWCEQRLQELNSRPSITNPIWYSLSLSLGAIAGYLGDQWSLGFVVETERQVVRHLQEHQRSLPAQDLKSRAIVNQMEADESEHATMAVNAGGAELPATIKLLMTTMAKLMTTIVYYPRFGS